jgi:dimethylargininase
VGPFGYRVRPVAVRGCLHLKSACNFIGDAVLVHRPWVDEAAFAGVRLVDVPEECGANVLAIGGTVLAPAAAPRTAELLIGLGRQVRVLDLTGQCLPDSMRWRGESLKTTQHHIAQ